MTRVATHCPNCQTPITLSARLVQESGDKVRCGGCLRLFSPLADARATLIDHGSTAAIRARALQSDFSPEADDHSLDAAQLAKASQWEAETLQLPVQHRRGRRSWLLHLAKFAALLLLLTSLAAQYLWANRSLYQHAPSLYPLYVMACGQLDCSVPTYSDVSLLRGYNLSVSASTEGRRSLRVDFILTNDAPLPQDPPVLILSFNTAANRSVALREFAPADYFPGNLNSQAPLAPGQRVPIRLALVDPGPQAVNYTIAFRAF